MSDVEVEGLVQALAAVLEQYVLAGNAQVRGTMLHVRRHILRAQDHERHVAAARRNDELAGSLRILGRQRCLRARAAAAFPRGLGPSTGQWRRLARQVVPLLKEFDSSLPSSALIRPLAATSDRTQRGSLYCLSAGAPGDSNAPSLVRKGLMSTPPLRVNRASTASRSGVQARCKSTKMRSTQCS